MNTKIIVCCHKEDVRVSHEPYVPIQAGRILSHVDLNIIGDDSGDNISIKNGSYCELTTIYWAWKNFKDVDIIGLCHYRRYFDFHNQCPPYMPAHVFKTKDMDSLNFTIPEDVLNSVADGKVVMSKKYETTCDLFTYCCLNFISDNMRLLEELIVKTQDEKYISAFYEIMHRRNKFSPCNMFLMNWKHFDEYCSWLFSLLGDFESIVDISSYNKNQKRIFGFMSEYLLNVYVLANGLAEINKPIMIIDDNSTLFNESRLKYYRLSFQYKIALLMTRFSKSYIRTCINNIKNK